MAHIKFDENHENRIKQELVGVGMSNYGLMKGETRHLPAIIHEDEHIGGVVYGRYENGGGMLVATDKRVLFLDHKIFFKKTDEISYDVISGVSYNKQGDFASVTLHTKLGDFTLRYASNKNANHFVHFIENVQIEHERHEKSTTPTPPFEQQSGAPRAELSQDAKIFLETHDLGVLSTIDRQGNVHGAAVYYVLGDDHQIFIATKSETHKAQDILIYHQVAFTIFDVATMRELQISGTARREVDQKLAEAAFHKILRPRIAGNHATVPPILHISAGEYVLIAVTPNSYKYHDYKSW